MYRTLSLFFTTLFVAAAQAQLFVGVDDPTSTARIGDVSDLSNVTYADAFDGIEIWGATYDPAGSELWLSSGIDMYRSPVSGPPVHVGTFTDGSASLAMTGLGWANGHLYGFRSVGTVGIYEINTNTGFATLALATPAFDFGGFDYNPADGLFYGANDAAGTPGRGLFSINLFGGGAITKIASYPAGQVDIDGLAVGGGKAWLVTDDPGNFFAYDLSQGQNGSYTPFAGPWSSSEIFAAAAYVPEPATLSVLLAGLVALRRRR